MAPFKTHCKNGHPFDDENTRICSVTGRRKCRACQTEFAKASSRKTRRAQGIEPVIPLRDSEWLEGREYEVRDCGYETPCWIWQRTLSGAGYGTVMGRGRRILAHRIAFERAFGWLADRLHVHHKCEQKACVNPRHLIALTPREHRRAHGSSVLGPDLAREIRVRAQAGESMCSLAKEYGVTHGSINHIVSGRSYVDAA
jgi:hypothetical protein